MKWWKEERAERVEVGQSVSLSSPTPGGDYGE